MAKYSNMSSDIATIDNASVIVALTNDFTSTDTPIQVANTTDSKSPTIAVSTVTDATLLTPTDACQDKAPLPFSTIRISDDLWSERLQDVGCKKEEQKQRAYRQNKVPAYGPYELHYYGLSSIVIDFIKNINCDKSDGSGWTRFPKNMSDTKIKLIQLLLEYRVKDNSNVFHLDQTSFIGTIETMWGCEIASGTIVDNDKIRLIGLLFIDNNSDKLYRLAQGVNNRQDIDDPALSPRAIFELLSLDFNNNEIILELPDEVMDIDGCEGLDPNDISRIRIKRDGKIFPIFTFFIKTNLTQLCIYYLIFFLCHREMDSKDISRCIKRI